MQNLDLKLTMSDTTVELIDAIRTTRTREDVVRQLIELGLSEILETTARLHREATVHGFYGVTQDLKAARTNLLSIRLRGQNSEESEESDSSAIRRYETIQSITGRAARG